MVAEEVGGKRNLFASALPQEGTFIVHHRAQATVLHPNAFNQLILNI